MNGQTDVCIMCGGVNGNTACVNAREGGGGAMIFDCLESTDKYRPYVHPEM